VLACFERRAVTRRPIGLGERAEAGVCVDVAARLRDMWR
jgi:hypothetical protein